MLTRYHALLLLLTGCFPLPDAAPEALDSDSGDPVPSQDGTGTVVQDTGEDDLPDGEEGESLALSDARILIPREAVDAPRVVTAASSWGGTPSDFPSIAVRVPGGSLSRDHVYLISQEPSGDQAIVQVATGSISGSGEGARLAEALTLTGDGSLSTTLESSDGCIRRVLSFTSPLALGLEEEDAETSFCTGAAVTSLAHWQPAPTGEAWLVAGEPAHDSDVGQVLLFHPNGTDEALALHAGADLKALRLGETLLEAGDLDGDGLGELVIRAAGFDNYSSPAGRIFIISGDWVPDNAEISDVATVVDGDSVAELLGEALAAGFDADGDGLLDLAISAPGANLVHLVPGSAQGPAAEVAIATIEAGPSHERVDRFGEAVAVLPPSADSSTAARLAISAPAAADPQGNLEAGVVWTLDLPDGSGVYEVQDLARDRHTGEMALDGAGSSLAAFAIGEDASGLMVGGAYRIPESVWEGHPDAPIYFLRNP